LVGKKEIDVLPCGGQRSVERWAAGRAIKEAVLLRRDAL